jgi:hypothetical protein
MRSTKILALLTAAVFVLMFSQATTCAFAQEHPTEHPTKEHPSEAKAETVTKDAIAAAVTAHVMEEAKDNEGMFVVHDDVEDKDLSLTLDKVHKDRLSQISENEYFACADFKSKEGAKYDLDFFLEGDSPDELEVKDVSIHKKNDIERYTWMEKDGKWEKKEIEQ